MKLSNLREDYRLAQLDEQHIHSNPFTQFEKWFTEALEAQIKDPNAMSLATVDEDLQPNLRIVLLKDLTEEGFTFFTNYNSKKGGELAHNNKACLNFFWKELERQVRIKGTITKVSEAESDEYFYSRPIESQIGAIASQQSQTLNNRSDLEQQIESIKNSKQAIKRPENWGGYRLKPTYFEFWQGRASRLHDRLAFNLINNNWKLDRLYP